ESEALQLQVPYEQLQIEFDEAEARIQFRNENEPDWFVYTSDARVLKHRALLSHTQTRNQIEARRSQAQLKKAVVVTGIVLGICFALVMCFSLAMNYMIRSLVRGVPVSAEQQFGD